MEEYLTERKAMQAILNTAYGELTIRPFQVKDIDSQMDYLYDSSNDFLESIGSKTIQW